MPVMICRLLALILLGAALFAPAVPAHATNTCGSSCSCTLSTTNITLSGYNPISNQPLTGTGTVTVSCQLLSLLGLVSVPYTVSLSKGSSGNYAARKMAGPGSNKLSYNLYSNPAMTVIWGDGTGSSQLFSSNILVSVFNLIVPASQTVYAQIPASQNIAIGTYSDSITATLQF